MASAAKKSTPVAAKKQKPAAAQNANAEKKTARSSPSVEPPSRRPRLMLMDFNDDEVCSLVDMISQLTGIDVEVRTGDELQAVVGALTIQKMGVVAMAASPVHGSGRSGALEKESAGKKSASKKQPSKKSAAPKESPAKDKPKKKP